MKTTSAHARLLAAADEASRESEAKYRGLLEAAPDAMVVVNGAGEIVLLNLQAEKQFGYHRDELVGQPVTNIIPEGFAERLIADDLRSAADALAQQIGTGIELVALRKDGTEFPIEIMLSPLESAEGILVTAAIRDISVRKAAEAELKGQARLLDLAHDAIVVRDPDSHIMYWSKGAEATYGWTAEEATGHGTHELLHTVFPVSQAAVDAALEAVGDWTGELGHTARDGRRLTVESRQSVERDTQGRVRAILEINRNISVRKAAEEHLAQSEGRYRGLLEAAPDAMVVVNGAGEIVLLNLQAEKQFGYRRDELVGQPVTNIIPEGFAERLIADDLRSTEAALAQVIGTGIELVARRKDGTEFPIEIMLSPLESAEGILVTAAIRDISVRKAAEEELHRTHQLLETTQAMARLGGWELDVVHDTLFWTDETYLIHEISPAEYSPTVATSIRFYAPESRPLITAAVQNAIERGTPFDLDLDLITATGRRISVRATGVATMEQGRTTKITGAFQDITERKESEGRYRGLLEAAPDAMVVVNGAGEIVLLNVQAEKQFGYRRDELVGQPVTNIIPEGFAERLIADDLRSAADALAQQIGTGIELVALRKDGTEFPIEIMLSPLQGAEGILVTAAIRDISVRKAAEEALFEEKERALITLNSIGDAVISTDISGNITFLNLVAEHTTGWSSQEAGGRPIAEVFRILDATSRETIPNPMEKAVGQDRTVQLPSGCLLIRRDGLEIPIDDAVSPIHDREGQVIGAVIVFRDVSAAHDMARRMTHSAQHDFLTGLPNRMLLNDRIGQAIASAPRHTKHIAVLFLDLDGFKYINDSLGHPIGDRLLQSVARRLVECVRASDTVSRQGGDEFVVLLSEAAQWVDAAMVARRMLEAVAEPHSIDQRDLHITTSIGVSVYPDDGEDAETLVKNADTAMYQAKENGRQSYQFFTPAMNVRAVERQSVEEGLRRALERQEFVLHYQPKIDLRTGAISGAEALIRWMHPTRGLLPPTQFIPIAEDCGLIVPIDNWVLRGACEQARAWLEAGLPAMTMAVNVAAMELQGENFLEGLFAILSETGLDPRSLEVELTESVLMKHARSAASILRTLRGRGVRVAVDDFGTGYSSLSYLRKFAVDALKIDQSFVSQITSAGDDASIVTAVISMARSLKLRVIAEGVETLEQLAFLQSLECDEAQGFYFSRPVPPQQFAELLRTGIPGAGRSVDGSDRVPVGSRRGRGRVPPSGGT